MVLCFFGVCVGVGCFYRGRIWVYWLGEIVDGEFVGGCGEYVGFVGDYWGGD